MTSAPTAPVPWPALLDALEERLRRLEQSAAGAGDPVAPQPDLVPDGPLPDELRLRALCVLDATRRLEEDVARRFAGAQRALAYAGR